MRGVSHDAQAAFYLVQHAPGWMLDTFADRLNSQLQLDVRLARRGDRPELGRLLIAPGDRHLAVEKGSLGVLLEKGPRENHLRPSADWLFRSAAAAFGRYCVAVVLTGLGSDGTIGAAHVAAAGGLVIAEDPKTAIMPFMPGAAIDVGVAKEVVPLTEMSATIERHVRRLAVRLRRANAA